MHERDLKYSGNLKPTIRLLKYWNYLQQRPFTSFEIEKQILEKYFECKTLSEYFFSGALSLMDIAKSDKQKKFIELIREKRRRLKILEVNSLNEYIEIELNSFLSE